MDETAARAALEALIAERGESYAALSRMLGRNAAYLQQFVKRGSPRRLDERDRTLLARYFGVAGAVLGGPDAVELVPVPRLDIGASAGPGRIADDGAVRQMALDPALLRRLGVRAAAASMIRVEGTSMEPTLADGDAILIDGDRRRPGSRAALFVLRGPAGVQVKRLRLLGDTIEIASDNPEAPSPRLHPAAEVDVVGRVVWLSRALV